MKESPSRSLMSCYSLLLAACVARPAPHHDQGAASVARAPAPVASSTQSTPGGTMIFLLIGQSNMVGAPRPAAEDEVENARVKVLAYEDCPALGRHYNQWSVAKPPLHGCSGGVGPGDYFGRTLANAFPNATIGLVPLAINGVDVDFFVKGAVSTRRREFRIPPDDHWAGAYEWVIERARLAQQAGTIRGILFHQGESDTGNAPWVGKVQRLVADLRTDLNLGQAPFVAGELLYAGCCGKWHNPLVAQLPAAIPSARVVSAGGLAGMDTAHFDLPAQRELGARYAAAMLELLGSAAPSSPAQ